MISCYHLLATHQHPFYSTVLHPDQLLTGHDLYYRLSSSLNQSLSSRRSYPPSLLPYFFRLSAGNNTAGFYSIPSLSSKAWLIPQVSMNRLLTLEYRPKFVAIYLHLVRCVQLYIYLLSLVYTLLVDQTPPCPLSAACSLGPKCRSLHLVEQKIYLLLHT